MPAVNLHDLDTILRGCKAHRTVTRVRETFFYDAKRILSGVSILLCKGSAALRPSGWLTPRRPVRLFGPRDPSMRDVPLSCSLRRTLSASTILFNF